MKICFKCKIEYPIESFHKHKEMADGRLNKCKYCVKKDVDTWRKLNPDCRKKEADKVRNKKGFKTREQWKKDLQEKAIGRKASALKYAYKRRRMTEKMFQSELDIFVFQEAVLLCAIREKQFGFKWEVDHIVPMMHKKACGLNSASNFQVVPKSWNNKKSNKNMNIYQPGLKNMISGY
jgi:hypothetical protein